MSTGSRREREQSRKLQIFLTDLALLGSLQGFKYFQPWLRGKEELLLTVVNEDMGWRSPGFVVSAASSSSSSSSTASSSSSTFSLASDGSSPLPQEPGARMLLPSTLHTQKAKPLTNRDQSSEPHLLPASPSEGEIAVPEVNCTLFLLAGYAKYGHPYAWIRSNHERLVNIGGTDTLVKDTPLKLKSITEWQTQGVRVWDIVNELVCLCTIPCPSNPIALDMHYLNSLPLAERFLVSGALLNFLEMYAIHGNHDELHYDKVLEEVKILRRLHFQTLLEVQRQRGTDSLAPAPPQSAPQGEQ